MGSEKNIARFVPGVWAVRKGSVFLPILKARCVALIIPGICLLKTMILKKP